MRELQNTIQRACILSQTEILEVSDFEQDHLSENETPKQNLNQFMEDDERAFIISALQKNNLKMGKTADEIGISRKGLWQKMKRLGIDRNSI